MTSTHSNDLKSMVSKLRWPALVDTHGGQLATLLFQLEQTQWLSPASLRQHQQTQLDEVLAHAVATVPFYQQRFRDSGWIPGQPVSTEQWLKFPLLKRSELQEKFSELQTSQLPKDHGGTTGSQTSGSSGQPVKFLATSLTQLMWEALTFRFHLWHRHDFQSRLCSIRTLQNQIRREPQNAPSWGRPISHLFASGPATLLDCRNDLRVVLKQVLDAAPDYLAVMPSTLKALAELSLAEGLKLPNLRQIITFSEMVEPETRDRCREAWGASIADMYSCEEAGYIALQCPDHEQYHIQSESLLVEVLDDDGQPCRPGQIGRVVISTLLNFATPLIRYELQDYVEVGEPCPCGRGLPVIRKIMGRRRNLITAPDGARFWPVLYASAWSGIADIRQLQLIQKTPSHFDAKVVIDRNLTPQEEAALSEAISKSFGYSFTFRFLPQSQRITSRNGKFESIFSEVGAASSQSLTN